MSLQVKPAAWGALLVSLSACANMPYSATEYKHVISTITFAILALTFSYFAPVRSEA